MDRRSFIGAFALTALSGCAYFGKATAPGSAADASETIPLWPGTPPGGAEIHLTLKFTDYPAGSTTDANRAATGIAQPTLYVFRAPNPNGSAILIVPGGGYREIWIDHEGFEIARRFNEAGITAFVLLYRLPREGWKDASDVPLQDAQRAVRLIRTNASDFRIDPERIGVLGFSAGGHVAASLATRFAAPVYAAVDAADKTSARPDFAALLYPVITMLPPYAHEASREMLLGPRPTDAQRAAYSCEQHVSHDTPPTFLAAAADDTDVAPENALRMFAALRAAHVPAEMHMFEKGGHGFAIPAASDLPAAAWPDLLLRWGASRGYWRTTGADIASAVPAIPAGA